jgi:hypothetical protein
VVVNCTLNPETLALIIEPFWRVVLPSKTKVCGEVLVAKLNSMLPSKTEVDPAVEPIKFPAPLLEVGLDSNKIA